MLKINMISLSLRIQIWIVFVLLDYFLELALGTIHS